MEVYTCIKKALIEAVEAAMIVHLAKCTRLLVLNVMSKLKYLLSQMGQDQSIAGIVTKNAGHKDISQRIQ